MIQLPRIYAIADSAFGDPVELCRQFFRGGLNLVQIRAKTASSRELLGMVRAVLTVAPPAAMVFVNDRADIALLSGCSGVHLGQDDLPPRDARRFLGDGFRIGLSTHNAVQFEAAQDEPVDYVAVGPVFATTTKANPDPVIGVGQLSGLISRRRKSTVAIGGITLQNALSVLETGVDSVAVIRGLLDSDDVSSRCRTFAATVEAWHEQSRNDTV